MKLSPAGVGAATLAISKMTGCHKENCQQCVKYAIAAVTAYLDTVLPPDEGELVRRLRKIAKDAQMPKDYYLSETADSTFNEVSKTCHEAASHISALEQRVREAEERTTFTGGEERLVCEALISSANKLKEKARHYGSWLTYREQVQAWLRDAEILEKITQRIK